MSPPRKKKPAKSRKIPLIEQLHEVEIRPGFKDREPEIKTMTTGEHVCWLISEYGIGIETAAAIVDISDRTIWKWQHRGQEWISEALKTDVNDESTDDEGEPEEVEVPESEVPYVRFVQGLKKARGEAEIFHLKNIKLHSRMSWQASAWYLERVKPERYARRSAADAASERNREGGVEPESFIVPGKDWNEKVTQVAAEAIADREKALRQKG